MAASSDARTIDLFLDMLAAEQGAGDNTLNAYRSDLEDLAAFLARAKQDFAHADTQVLRDYLADLDQRGFKSSSVARRLSSMRHLFRFLLNERKRTDDPAAIFRRSRASSSVASSTPCSRATSRSVRPLAAASLTMSAALS